jgi:hypothetical protein
MKARRQIANAYLWAGMERESEHPRCHPRGHPKRTLTKFFVVFFDLTRACALYFSVFYTTPNISLSLLRIATSSLIGSVFSSKLHSFFSDCNIVQLHRHITGKIYLIYLQEETCNVEVQIKSSIIKFHSLNTVIIYNMFLKTFIVALGTWLGISETGKLAFLTNWRVPVEENGLVCNTCSPLVATNCFLQRSRGELCTRYLSGKESLEEFQDFLHQHGTEVEPFSSP